MSLYAHKPIPEALKVRIIAIAKSEPELTLANLSERFGLGWRAIGPVLEAAGLRSPKPRRRSRRVAA